MAECVAVATEEYLMFQPVFQDVLDLAFKLSQQQRVRHRVFAHWHHGGWSYLVAPTLAPTRIRSVLPDSLRLPIRSPKERKQDD